MKWKVGCIQMDIVLGDPEANKAAAADWFAQAEKEGCQVAVLPELWTTGYDFGKLDKTADPKGSGTISFLQKQAKKHQLHIIGGSVAKSTARGVTNTMYVIGRDGSLVHEYSKLHLFRLMREEQFLVPGEEETGFELEGLKAAGFICYDIRFPEWQRKAVLGGAEILFAAAEWPASRIAHWRILLQARAIENQCFVVACNRIGEDRENEFGGHSLIIDPWGEVIAEGGSGEELVTALIDTAKIQEIRTRIPVFSDRRPESY